MDLVGQLVCFEFQSVDGEMSRSPDSMSLVFNWRGGTSKMWLGPILMSSVWTSDIIKEKSAKM